MTFRLGLTGGIGMGKSTTARIFADLGHPVWDADAAVHRLYASGGAAVAPIAAAFPGAVQNSAVDRAALRAILADDPEGFPRLERIVHPLLAGDRQAFLAAHADAPIIVFDIPLLFEGGLDAQMDGTATVSTDAETQRQRVLDRPDMTPENFRMILSRQMPDAEKRQRADWIIPTDSLEGAARAVRQICKEILENA